MGHENSLSQSTQYEAKKKKRKLSKKQKLMGVGATVATGVALFGAGTMVGGSANKVKTPQGLEQVDLSKTEHGQEQFKQILDPNEQSRLVSEGVDAPTPEAALDELFNAMGHDYRILDVYANLSGAYNSFGLDSQEFNDQDLQAWLLSDDGKTLSSEGQQILKLVKVNLTEGVRGNPEDVTVQFVDLKDEITNDNWGPLYMTGIDKDGLVRDTNYNTFGDNTKAVNITFPAVSGMPNDGGRASITFAVSGGQPILDGSSQIDSVPVGLTEAQGHQPIEPLGSETGGY